MRRTKLIPLPHQVEAARTGNDSNQEGFGEGSSLVAYQSSESVPSPVLINSPSQRDIPRESNLLQEPVMATMEDFNAFNRITFDPPAQPPPNLIIEERQRNTALDQNNSVPIIHFVDEQQQQPATAPVLFDPPRTPPRTMTIPRQLGRRSEHSPRIVAINAESNTIIISHNNNNNNSRPISAPARVGLAESAAAAAAGESAAARRTVRDRNSRERGEFDSMSSVASSRNPSPVSLLSTSGSSMASARNNSTER